MAGAGKTMLLFASLGSCFGYGPSESCQCSLSAGSKTKTVLLRDCKAVLWTSFTLDVRPGVPEAFAPNFQVPSYGEHDIDH